MLVLATVFAAASFAASIFLAPRRPTAAKLAPYECGIVPEHESPERFPVKFYMVAMAFIMFDVELIFLYPFMVVFRGLELFGLVAMGIFLLVLFVAYAYELASGALDWGPARRIETRPVTPVRRASSWTAPPPAPPAGTPQPGAREAV